MLNATYILPGLKVDTSWSAIFLVFNQLFSTRYAINVVVAYVNQFSAYAICDGVWKSCTKICSFIPKAESLGDDQTS